MKKWHWFMLSILIIICDQASKYWASVALVPYIPVPIMPMVNFTLAYNTGAAFGFFNGAGGWYHWFFAGFSLLMSILFIIWLYRIPSKNHLLLAGVSLILGGAIGNLYDRALYGYVIDFVDVYFQNHHFATFNIADSAISVGALLFILDMLLNRK